MRNWQLDGHGISSHQKSLQDKNSLPIRVVLQPAGSSEKVSILNDRHIKDTQYIQPKSYRVCDVNGTSQLASIPAWLL